MRISDWSSDVCSSDLVLVARFLEVRLHDGLGISVGFLGRQSHALGRPFAEEPVAARGDTEQHVLVAREFRLERSEEHTSELQSLMRISYAVFCLKKKIILISNTPISVLKSSHALQHVLHLHHI